MLLRGRHVRLGKHGSPESHEAYARVIAEHLSGPEPRAVPDPGTPAAVASGAGASGVWGGGAALPARPASVDDLPAAYLDFAEGDYSADGGPTQELRDVKASLKPLRELYGRTPAAEFGPKRLKAVREHVAGVRGAVRCPPPRTRSAPRRRSGRATGGKWLTRSGREGACGRQSWPTVAARRGGGGPPGRTSGGCRRGGDRPPTPGRRRLPTELPVRRDAAVRLYLPDPAAGELLGRATDRSSDGDGAPGALNPDAAGVSPERAAGAAPEAGNPPPPAAYLDRAR